MEAATASKPATTPAEVSARSVFLAWERLRLFYNAVLIVIVLFFFAQSLGQREFWDFLAVAAFLANVCFCLGPVGEGYLALLGMDREVARWLVFFLGTLFACLLALVALFSWHFAKFD